jgi:hypothetical protein
LPTSISGCQNEKCFVVKKHDDSILAGFIPLAQCKKVETDENMLLGGPRTGTAETQA